MLDDWDELCTDERLTAAALLRELAEPASAGARQHARADAAGP
jgi:hypothetical protein